MSSPNARVTSDKYCSPPQSLDSGIATRSVSSLSPEREEREEGRANYGFRMEEEREGGRPDKGRGRPLVERKKREEREGDIVSDIYSTAFSKVPKVRKPSQK